MCANNFGFFLLPFIVVVVVADGSSFNITTIFNLNRSNVFWDGSRIHEK